MMRNIEELQNLFNSADEEGYEMFNSAKKVAKKFTWHFLRNAQRLSFNSKVGSDPRIDSRKLMVSLGAFGIYMNLNNDKDISTSQLDHFLNYVYERAPKDIHDLLAEYRLEQLDANSFRQCYSDLVMTCVDAETRGEDVFSEAVFYTFFYALKDDYRDSDNLNYILDNYMDEIKHMVYIMQS